METNVPQPSFENMDVGEWKRYLKNNPDRLLCINAPDGVHTIQYDEYDERVTFYAFGTQGYDKDGTEAVLEDVAGESEGLCVQTVEETFK